MPTAKQPTPAAEPTAPPPFARPDASRARSRGADMDRAAAQPAAAQPAQHATPGLHTSRLKSPADSALIRQRAAAFQALQDLRPLIEGVIVQTTVMGITEASTTANWVGLSSGLVCLALLVGMWWSKLAESSLARIRSGPSNEAPTRSFGLGMLALTLAAGLGVMGWQLAVPLCAGWPQLGWLPLTVALSSAALPLGLAVKAWNVPSARAGSNL